MKNNFDDIQIKYTDRFECYFPDFLKLRIWHYSIILFLCFICYRLSNDFLNNSWIAIVSISITLIVGLLSVAIMRYMARGYMEIDEQYIQFHRSFQSFTLPHMPIGGYNAGRVEFYNCKVPFISLEKITHNRCYRGTSYYEELYFYYKNGNEQFIEFSLDRKGNDNLIIRQQFISIIKKYAENHHILFEQIEKSSKEQLQDEWNKSINPKPTSKTKDTIALILTIIAFVLFLPLVILFAILLLTKPITFNLILCCTVLFAMFALLCRVLISRIKVIKKYNNRLSEN